MSGERFTPPGAKEFKAVVPTDQELEELAELEATTDARLKELNKEVDKTRLRDLIENGSHKLFVPDISSAALTTPKNKGSEGDLGKISPGFKNTGHPHEHPNIYQEE